MRVPPPRLSAALPTAASPMSMSLSISSVSISLSVYMPRYASLGRLQFTVIWPSMCSAKSGTCRSTVFACIAVLLVPLPFVFSVYGRQIRASGEWSRLSV